MRADAVTDLEAEDPRWATFLVRVEPTVLEQIRARARAADRSMAAEVRRALRAWVVS